MYFRTLFRPKLSKLIFYFSLLITSISCSINPNDRPSPLRIEKSFIGDVALELSYSSPAVRERKIFGFGSEFLQPYGELWRTGANKASTIYIDKSLLFADSFLLDSGKYAIFSIPGEEKWTLIFNKNWDQWGSYNYRDSLDIFRIELNTKVLQEKAERMQLYVENDSLKFRWDQIGWGIPINHPL